MAAHTKNHFVSAGLLRGFTDSTGTFWKVLVADGRRFPRQRPEKVAREHKLYWVEGVPDPSGLERELAAEIDGPAALVFGRLRERPRLLMPRELNDVLFFIALQMTRIPSFRKLVDDVFHSEMSKHFADNVPATAVARESERMGRPEVSKAKLLTMLKRGDLRIKPRQNLYLRSMLDAAEGVIPWLRRRRWSVRTVPIGCPSLISSDLPVKSIQRSGSSWEIRTGRLSWANAEVMLAVSSHVALLGADRKAVVAGLRPDEIAAFNVATAAGASELYSVESDIFGLDAEQLRRCGAAAILK